jgi:hypothetical protein
VNLQQTNTNGYKFQGSTKLLEKAKQEVAKWGKGGAEFSSSKSYQKKVKSLLGKYPYRLDTNFAKMDRIEHASLEKFKEGVLSKKIDGKTILSWAKTEWGKLLDTSEAESSEIAEDLM